MREILFRGKCVDNGKWFEGDLVRSYPISGITKYFIGNLDLDDLDADVMDADVIEVSPETVGQYTGLTDKNGKKIFEGDIIEFPNHCNGGTCIGKIEYSDEDTAFQILYDENVCCLLGHNFHGAELEILGNIHDNPELVGGANE